MRFIHFKNCCQSRDVKKLRNLASLWPIFLNFYVGRFATHTFANFLLLLLLLWIIPLLAGPKLDNSICKTLPICQHTQDQKVSWLRRTTFWKKLPRDLRELVSILHLFKGSCFFKGTVSRDLIPFSNQ